MDPNMTPTSSRNRSTRAGSSQDEQQLPQFSQFQGSGYIPQFQDPNSPFQPFPYQPYQPYNPHLPFGGTNVPFELTPGGMIASGQRPTYFGNPPRRTQIHEDIVPETQQSNPTPESYPTPESNPTPVEETKQKRQAWKKVEEEALMRAYIDVSEDPIVGNAQPSESFWKRVESVFYNIMGREPYRSNHQIYTKGTNLKTKVTRFAAIYNQLVRSRSSGSSDADILTLAYRRYKEETKQNFCHEHCWAIVKHNPKWTVIPTISTDSSRGTKRSKTSDDSDARFNLDDDDDDNEDEAHEPQRPIGRNKAKRAATSTTSGSNSSDKITQLVDTITDLSTTSKANLEYKMKKLDLRMQSQRLKDYKFYMTPHDHLTGIDLEVCKKMKEEIKMKYNL